MTGKIIGLTIILLLVLSIVATGIGAVAQGGLEPPNTNGPALAQSGAAQVAAADDENALYAAFTYVCPFH